MKNTIIAILVIALVVLGFLFIREKNKQSLVDNSWPETEPATPTTTNNSSAQNYPNWTEKRFGWYYPPGWDGYSTEVNGDAFGITNTNTGTEIRVGAFPGTTFELGCEQNQLEEFQYGASVSACVNGVLVFLANPSGRWAPSQNEKQVFGDFVLKNQR